MALSRTDYAIQSAHGRGNVSTAYVTGSLALPASALVIVIASGIANNSAAVRPSQFTLANSAGLTMTAIVTTGAPVQWGYGIRAWRMETTSGVSSTFTVQAPGDAIEAWDVAVLAYTGYDTATPIGGTIIGTDANGTGAASITLSAAPAAGDEAIGCLSAVVVSGVAPTVTPGAGWTEVGETSETDWGYFQYQIRTGSTSTAVAWVDVGSGGSPSEAMLAGFVVRAGAGGSVAPPGFIAQPGPGLQGPASPSRFQKLRAGNATTSPDITLGVTGVTATGSVGTVTNSRSVPVTGVTGTGSAGTVSTNLAAQTVGAFKFPGPGVTPFNNNQFLSALRNTAAASTNITIAVTGVTATASVGTVTPAMSKAVTGNSATGSAGTVVANGTIIVSGVSATASVGAVVPSASVPVTGVSATGSAGSVTTGSDITLPVTGVTATGSAGTVVPSMSKAVTGNSATASVGTVVPSASRAVTGNIATGSVGTVVPSMSVPLTGVAGTAVVGTVTPASGNDITLAVTGVTATGSVGIVLPRNTRALTGVSATGSAGNVGAPGGGVFTADSRQRFGLPIDPVSSGRVGRQVAAVLGGRIGGRRQ